MSIPMSYLFSAFFHLTFFKNNYFNPQNTIGPLKRTPGSLARQGLGDLK